MGLDRTHSNEDRSTSYNPRPKQVSKWPMLHHRAVRTLTQNLCHICIAQVWEYTATPLPPSTEWSYTRSDDLPSVSLMFLYMLMASVSFINSRTTSPCSFSTTRTWKTQTKQSIYWKLSSHSQFMCNTFYWLIKTTRMRTVSNPYLCTSSGFAILEIMICRTWKNGDTKCGE